MMNSVHLGIERYIYSANMIEMVEHSGLVHETQVSRSFK